MAKGKRKKMAQRDIRSASKRSRLQKPSPEDLPGQVPGQSPRHHVQVLTSDQRLDFLLEMLNRPSGEQLTTVVFAGTKAGCDRLHAALAAQQGSARWGMEVVHGNKRRDEQEASLQSFASGKCHCLLATETVARKLAVNAFADGPGGTGAAAVDFLINYELPEDFFVRSAETHKAFIRRIGNRGCTTFLRTDSFGDTDVKAAHSLLTQLEMEYPDVPIPPALAALNPGFAAVSARQARKGLLPASGEPLPALTPDPDVCSTGGGPTAPPLVFCFVISGRPTDRGDGPRHASSWVQFDQSFRGRRDALSRCLTAALWSRPAVANAGPVPDYADSRSSESEISGSGSSSSQSTVVYNDREVWLVFAESPVRVVKLAPDWARCIGARTSPTEQVLLSAFDEAVRGRRSAAGLTLDPTAYPSVRSAMQALLQQHKTTHAHSIAGVKPARHVVLELHDSQDLFLPIYGDGLDPSNVARSSPGANDRGAEEVGSMILALGCVEDHLDSIAAIVDEANHIGYATGRVNVGPLTEFSSKVVHLIQAHHDSGRLRPAVEALLSETGSTRAHDYIGGTTPAPASVWRQKARAPRKGGGLMGERVPSTGVIGMSSAAVCDLHFWVWSAKGVSTKSALPSAQDVSSSVSPKLCEKARQQAWLLVSGALVAVAKSHGAYDRKEGVATCRVSFVFEDGVVTLTASLVQRFVGARGWGALTEHHLLVAIRDAIMAEPDTTLHPTVGAAAVASCVRNANCAAGLNQGGDTIGQKRYHHIALAIDAEGTSTKAAELALYARETAMGDADTEEVAAARQCCLHLLLAPPAPGLEEISAAACWGEAGVVNCSLPNGMDCRNYVRTIVSLQGHNNCGQLYGAAVPLAQQPAACAIAAEKKKEKKKKKKEKKEKKKKEKSKRKSKKEERMEWVDKEHDCLSNDTEKVSAKKKKKNKNKKQELVTT